MCEQLVVTAPLDDVPVNNHQDLVRFANGRQPVCDDERRAALESRLQCALYCHLRLRVEVGCRLVQDHDAGCFQKQPG